MMRRDLAGVREGQVVLEGPAPRGLEDTPELDRRSRSGGLLLVETGAERVAPVPDIGTVAVVGLGYVGLPLAVEFGKRRPTIGFDISKDKIRAYRDGQDPTGGLDRDEMRAADRIEFTTDADRLRQADLVVIAVPTPVDQAHTPDLGPLVVASQIVGRHLKRGATVVYESTVYPGATEEICIPEIERSAGWVWKRDFFVGYSPERINPGDKVNTLATIVKIVAGDTPRTLDLLDQAYSSIVRAGVHRASSIRVAEAAKVIENTQRDLNIALVNELSLIFHRLGIDTLEVLEAAGTKWNFLPFRPGLVGGHCIGVDPYYLTHKAEMVGHHPQVILAGRRINDLMGKYVAEQTVKAMIQAGIQVKGADVIVLGLTFKENCSDLRNSKVVDLILELESYGVIVHVHDPVALPAEARHEYGVELVDWDLLPRAGAMVAAVAHDELVNRTPDECLEKLLPGAVYSDVKGKGDAQTLRAAGITVWRL